LDELENVKVYAIYRPLPEHQYIDELRRRFAIRTAKSGQSESCLMNELEMCKKPDNQLFSLDKIVRILEFESVEDLICLAVPSSLKNTHLFI
uniref:Guanylate kinase-like domain-containing protein n=1 Tax=Dracunculus medinensis TaxID=318479 RepID=A0A0N4US37_DRAME